MRMRIVLALAFLALAPPAAQAGKPKSPFHAFVSADGTPVVVSGLYAQRSLYDAVGVYWVSMNERPDIIGCVAVATSAGGSVGTIGIEPFNDTFFEVTTTVGAGAALADMPFYIVVHCPKWESGG